MWERSPYSDTYLGAMAAAQVKTFQLGQRGVVDFLGVSFSGLDYVGHDFGPDSHEVQDELIRLDRTLGQLFADLDAAVGRNRYVVGLSADHGVARIPEAQKASGVDAGRVVNAQVRKVAEAAMLAAHGQGSYVALAEYTNLYLTDSARQRAEADPAFLKPLIDAVAAVPGVQHVFPARGLETKRASANPVERAAALSYYPGESGDVVIVLKPNWIGTDTSTTTHGSLNPYRPARAGRVSRGAVQARSLFGCRVARRHRADAGVADQAADARDRRKSADRRHKTLNSPSHAPIALVAPVHPSHPCTAPGTGRT